MAKRKAYEEAEAEFLPADMSIEMPAVEETANAEPAPEAELIDGQFRVGLWQELPTLTCVICQWDTLDGLEAARAYKAKCPRCLPPPEPPKPVIVQAYDRFGNPID